jgi:flagellar basal-body rod protein FlgG
MLRALYSSAAGMESQQLNLDVIANNLANVNTTGFKRSKIEFQDLLYDTTRSPGAEQSNGNQLPTGLQIGHGSRAVATSKVFTEGELTQTGESLDMAIQGDGFFQVTMPDGTLAYTRDGSFQTNATGQVVTASGYVLQPAITIPSGAQSITIGSDGTVSVLLPGQTAPSTVGTLQLADFVNEAGLQPYGQNLLLPSAASGTAQTANPGLSGMGTLQQGATESSNVDVVSEMVNMIETQRAYEMDSKAIQTTDQMLQNLSTSL